MSENAEERDAVVRLKRGDIGGLEVLVHLYQVQALEAAYLITRDYAMAEDVVQASFLRAYERIGQFDGNRPFGPWFLRSVVNRALTAVMKQSNISLDVPQYHAAWDGDATRILDLPSQEPGLHELIEAAETKEEIIAALERLSPGQRAAVVLRYYLGYSDLDISEKLDVPPGTIRRRLHDARQRLRHLLAARTT